MNQIFQKFTNLNPVLRLATRNAGSRSWKITKLNHIAVAVPDLEKASAFYRDVLQADVGEPKPMREHGVTTVFVQLQNARIEVDDVYACLEDLKAKNIRTLDPQPKTGAAGAPVVFLHPKDTCNVLMELEHVGPGGHGNH